MHLYRDYLRRLARIGGIVVAVALASTTSVGCSASTTPHQPNATPHSVTSTPRSLSATPQAEDLVGRVDHSKYFSGCDVSAQPVTGAEATISCQPRHPDITVSASSFKITGDDIPFVPGEAAGESSGLNKYLKSTLPNGLSGILTSPGPPNPPACSVQEAASCLKVGYAGFWGIPPTILGRLYCYQRSDTYFVVYAFDNDSYEASFDEDFVVVASGNSLASLVQWWQQEPSGY